MMPSNGRILYHLERHYIEPRPLGGYQWLTSLFDDKFI